MVMQMTTLTLEAYDLISTVIPAIKTTISYTVRSDPSTLQVNVTDKVNLDRGGSHEGDNELIKPSIEAHRLWRY
jgi:hypothetical protein